MAEQETNYVPRISDPIPFAENLEDVECHQVDIATISGSDGEVYIPRGVKIIARNRRPNSSSEVDHAYLIDKNSSISLRGQCGIVLRGEILNHDRSNDKWCRTYKQIVIKKVQKAHVSRLRLGERQMSQNVMAMQKLERHYLDRVTVNVENKDERVTGAEDCLNRGIMTTIDVLSDEKYKYVIMPYCKWGEYVDAFLFGRDRNYLLEGEAQRIFRGMLNSVRSMHDAGISHRDLSVENLLYWNDDQIPVMNNYSMALNMTNMEGHRCLIRKTSYTTWKPYYTAPEVFGFFRDGEQRDIDGEAADLWALGVILFIMLTGHEPWENPLSTDYSFRMLTSPSCANILLTKFDFSEELAELLHGMFQANPSFRLSFDEVLNHQWVTFEPGPFALE